MYQVWAVHSTSPALDLLTTLPGVGPRRAAALLAHHGDALWTQLEKDPAAALTCPGGLPASQLEPALAAWAQMRAGRDLHELLSPIGLSWLVPRLLDLYGDGALRAVAADPYALVMRGADFAQADRLAAIVGPAPSALAVGRPEAAVHAALRANERRGGSCLAVGDLLADASRLLRGVVDTAVLDVACREKRIVSAGGLVWSVRAHAVEARVAVNLARLTSTALPWTVDRGGVSVSVTLAQARAVAAACRAGVSLCVGGAGTGKTRVIAALAEAAERSGKRVVLCAPTGRAARNLEAVTGMEASTVHRLVGWSGDDVADSTNTPAPLAADLVIVDEASLLDVNVFLMLLDVTPDGCHVVLCGDTTQLPAVGPGRVLQDLIDSAELPVSTLPHVMRQSARSGIALAAVAVSAGRLPERSRDLAAGGDFEIREICDTTAIVPGVVSLVTDELPSLFDVDPATEISVLCPGKHGVAGAHALNVALADALNPGVSRTDAGVGSGDRVMWTTNDIQLGLSNGTLLMLEPGDGVPGGNAESVRALAEDGRPLLLPPAGVDSLIPAWAMTVHKSQGLEVPIVVVVLCGEDTHPALLTRAMLYTAITRATRAAIVCADPRTLDRVLATGAPARRTALGQHIVARRAA